MFLFTTPKKVPRDVETELLSLCRQASIRHLPCGVRQDIGLDCGKVQSTWNILG